LIITRQKLIQIAHDEARKRSTSGDVISAYLIGSVVGEEPLLGGATDVDIVLIHAERPQVGREFIPLINDVHIDLMHHSQGLYARPRKLRSHPWLGPSIAEPIFLHDPDHFFEWAQAAVRGQFHRLDHVVARSRAFLSRARRLKSHLEHSPNWLLTYLHVALEGANTIASLIGPPACGRRLTLILEQRLHALDQSALFDRFMKLLGAQSLEQEGFPETLKIWQRAFEAASEISTDLELHTCRLPYHLQAFQALAEAGRHETATWTLLATWAIAMQALKLKAKDAPHLEAWEGTLESLQLTSRHAQARATALEGFLDQVERALEAWSSEHGE
jgi:hypothetical protein